MTEKRKRNRQNQKAHEKLRILSALIKSGASSDRELARQLGITNTLASRQRKELEQEDYINEYTVIPNFSKLGIEIVAFSFGLPGELLRPEQISKAQKWMNEQPEVLLCIEGQGFDSNFIMISAHKNYESYLAFQRKIRNEQETNHPSQNTQAFTIGTGKEALVLKPFSLRKMESLFLPPETQPQYPRHRKGVTKSTDRHSVERTDKTVY